MNGHLSKKMREAVDLLQSSPHKKLFRWDGGFWLTEPQKGIWKSATPSGVRTAFPYVKTLTVEALVARKIFVRDESSRDVYLTVVRLSDEKIQSVNSDSDGAGADRSHVPGDVAAHVASIADLPR